ncbi:hypothetical protein JXQ31_04715 [candidate division KSB1 bacterium]|nr:hypothetical protein [candidate division KSB1 bacterium]
MEDFGYDKRVPGGTLKPDDEQKRKLSHEIRSISHGLLGYLSILVEEIDDKLDDEEKELLSRVKYYSHKLSDLVLELLSNYNQEQKSGDKSDWNK